MSLCIVDATVILKYIRLAVSVYTYTVDMNQACVTRDAEIERIDCAIKQYIFSRSYSHNCAWTSALCYIMF